MRYVKACASALVLLTTAAPALAGSITGHILNFGLPQAQFAFAITNPGSFLVFDGSTGADLYYIDSGGVLTPIQTQDGEPVQIAGLNASGTAVGVTTTSIYENNKGVIWSKGTASLVLEPGCVGTSFDYINDSGEILGQCFIDESSAAGYTFTLQGSVVTPIDYPGSRLTDAFSVNMAGTVVGTYLLPGDENLHAFIFDNGAYTNVDPVVGNVDVVGLDDSGDVLVSTETPAIYGTLETFLIRNGLATRLVVAGSTANSTYGESISRNGHVLGAYEDAAGEHEFIYYNGIYSKSSAPKNPAGQPYDIGFGPRQNINDSGTVVGSVSYPPHYDRSSAIEAYCNGTGC